MKTNRWIILATTLLISFGVNANAQKGKGKEQQATTLEMFRVSQVGSSNDPEVRTKLKDLYQQIAIQFNAQAAADFKAAQETYAGQQLKITKRLQKKDDQGQLYLVAYDGDFAVLSLKNATLKKGTRTPPLEIERDGNFTTMVTRQQIRKKNNNGEPSESEPVTFFGIPILDSDEELVKVEVEEELPKYRGTVSTQVLTKAPTMDRELFLSTLKNGETFTATRDELRRCQNCRGFGRAAWNGIGKRPADGKSPCPDCVGIGTIPLNVTYTVGW